MKSTSMSLLSSRALLLTATAATLALSSTLISKPAFAGINTSSLDVSANVINTCTISTVAVTFGEITFPFAGDWNAEGSVVTKCTNGAAAIITLSQGANPASGSTEAAPLRQLADGANKLAYNLYTDTEKTIVWGNTTGTGGTGVPIAGTGQEVGTPVYGQIKGNQNGNVPVGSYQDAVLATVFF